jgi:hypothetical protein
MMIGEGESFMIMNGFLVATIDADIAKLSDNEFAPIFAGGILVMFGGVISALIVGAILESTNSYAEVIADSYAQSSGDEEFWKGLSEEERNKTRDLLQKVKREFQDTPTTTTPVETSIMAEQVTRVIPEQPQKAKNVAQPTTSAKESDKSLFSDY